VQCHSRMTARTDVSGKEARHMSRGFAAIVCIVGAACSEGTSPEPLTPGTFRFVVTGNRSERVTGTATINNPFPDFYSIGLTPASDGPNFRAGIGFYALGRPGVGKHQVRQFGEAPEVTAGCLSTQPFECPVWHSITGGELRITRSSPERVTGSFSADLTGIGFDSNAGKRIHIEADFDATCPPGATCR
jgi:hypothetical protein